MFRTHYLSLSLTSLDPPTDTPTASATNSLYPTPPYLISTHRLAGKSVIEDIGIGGWYIGLLLWGWGYESISFQEKGVGWESRL